VDTLEIDDRSAGYAVAAACLSTGGRQVGGPSGSWVGWVASLGE
jgi:hypothetical protein